MKKVGLSILGLVLFFSVDVSSGNDLIFVDGFDQTESEFNCPSAIALMPMTNSFGNVYYSATDEVNPAGTKKYFSVELNESDFFHIQVSSVDTGNGSFLSPVVSLYGNDGSELLGQSGKHYRTGASLNYRSITTGTYCFKVEDYSTFIGTEPQGGEEFVFIINVIPIDFDDYDGFNIDLEPNNSVANAQSGITFLNKGRNTQILGEFQDQNDRDIYQFTTSGSQKSLILNTVPVGATGHGSTTNIQQIQVIAENGFDVLARVNPSLGADELILPVEPSSDYYVVVSSPATPIGINPFYTVEWQNSEGLNQQEVDDVANNSYTDAEVANNIFGGGPLPPNFTAVYFIGGELNGTSDTDWWQFEVNNGEQIFLFCNSSHNGSGVQNAKFSVFENPASKALQYETENPSTGLNWSENDDATMAPININSTNTHYLKIEADDFSNEVLGRFYLCGLHLYVNL